MIEERLTEERLTEALTGTWDATRSARDALVDEGTAAVGPVLDVLCDERSPVDWTVSADVLRRLGEPALLPLAEAAGSADSPEVARRIQWVLERADVADRAAYEPLLEHPHPLVRRSALFAYPRRGEDGAAFLDRLLPLLGDPDPDVRRRAVAAVKVVGTGAVGALQRVRRRPATGPRIRAAALEALAEIGGPALLSDRDRAAWRRLTRIGQRTEVPEGLHLCGSWYAVPSADQEAVLAAFDLGHPEPVTLRTGAAAWNHDHHAWDAGGPHDGCARVFVSPALDGWTLVFGDTAEDTHRLDDADDETRASIVRGRCAELGRRFGAAQWYGMSCGDGWTAWCVAEGGEVVRYYDSEVAEDDGDEGPAHPAESGYLLPHQDGFPDGAFDDVSPSGSETFAERYHRVKEELRIPDTCYANDIAARLSVDPGALGPHTSVAGTGVVALTACGREHGHPAGALPA
ncbi:HEAT repeat domain-containing protein [Streptomyces sp. AS58]|uniref:HEAT repeat domain-containing protein n=1 Tax=Streptomyces sp. AS58 TaxID=1519489 RepID=UPI0006AF7D21|nr:HEAT repeat domain-containing protein [Streptomyces sp. AS58]